MAIASLQYISGPENARLTGTGGSLHNMTAISLRFTCCQDIYNSALATTFSTERAYKLESLGQFSSYSLACHGQGLPQR